MEESRFSRWMTWFANLFILNAAWLLGCLLFITIFPSTAALFAVVRQIQRNEEVSVVGAFVDHFKRNFVQSFLTGIVWIMLFILIVGNFVLIGSVRTALDTVLFATNAFALAIIVFGAIYYFPVLVHYDLRWSSLIKYSFVLSMSRLPTTLLCLLILSIVTLVTLQFVLPIMIAGSLTAYAVYYLCSRTFPPERVEQV